jgi:putative SOS response-associated peptidase YedK
MPVILAPDDYAPWLGEEPANPDQLKAMLRPYPPERLSMWPVDNVTNEAPDLAQPITVA